MTDADRLARARHELAAARHLAGGRFPAQAISRAYYAAFYAAQAALAELGETRSRPSGVSPPSASSWSARERSTR